MDGSQHCWGRQLFCWFVKITLAHEKWSKPFKMEWDRCETWNLEINHFFSLVQLYFSHRPVFLMAIEDMTNGQIDHHEKLASNIIRLPNANGYCHADKKYSQSIETMFILSLYFFFVHGFWFVSRPYPPWIYQYRTHYESTPKQALELARQMPVLVSIVRQKLPFNWKLFLWLQRRNEWKSNDWQENYDHILWCVNWVWAEKS